MRDRDDVPTSPWAYAAWPFAALLVVVVMMLTSGCSSLGPAKQASNTLRAALHEAAPILDERCVRPYEMTPDMTQEEARALLRAYDASGCARALRVYDSARVSHVALVAVVGAHEVQACAGVSKASRECDMPRALFEATQAASAVVDAVRALRGER